MVKECRNASVAHTGGLAPALFDDVKLLIFVAVNVFGALGWWLGEHFGVMTAFFASGVGAVLGVYVGWRTARYLLE